MTIALGEESQVLEIARLGEEGDYLMRGAGESPGAWFRVSTYIAEQLLMQDVDLAAAAPAEPAATVDAPTPEAAPHSS